MRREGAKDENGFTLIELLIVVAIIGILAAIAVPTLIAAQQRARYAAAAADTKEIITQAMVVVSDNNQVISALGASVGMTVPPSPTGLWDGTAPNAVTYMASVYDPWAPGGPCTAAGATLGTAACYNLSEVAAAGGCTLGPGCVVYAAWTVGVNGVDDDGGSWLGTAPPLADDLGTSSLIGCSFGPQVPPASPC